jgi:glycosyltransferase involved in cell wall biosynthesis
MPFCFFHGHLNNTKIESLTLKLLILSQYYPPETGAPQNRLHALAQRLQSNGVEVEVLTAMPNYPKMEIFEAYAGKKYVREVIDGITVHRSRIFVRKSGGIPVRLLNYYSFAWTSFWTGWRRLGKYDFIMVESPPLFLGKSAWLLSVLKGAGLIFNVSDLWPESAEKLGLVTNRVFLKLATWLEEFLYRKSVLITGQTQGIVANIEGRFPKKRVHWLPNGVDASYFDTSGVDQTWRARMGYQEDQLLLLYAGIVGHAQGLEIILKAAHRLQHHKLVRFIILGDGPVKADLIKLKEELKVENVDFLDPVGKAEIPAIIKSIDMALVPLKKLPLFEGAIPSKIFENLAMEKPLLLGVNGEAKTLFIDAAKAGLHFEPEDDAELAAQIERVLDGTVSLSELGSNGRAYVMKYFNRNAIADEFLNVLKSL